MVNKDVLIKGVSMLAYSFPFFFGGPILLFYAIQEENTLLKIAAGILMFVAMYLGAHSQRASQTKKEEDSCHNHCSN